jgi:cation diffusion facilitator CzcD-associated flavoprotein CzcO
MSASELRVGVIGAGPCGLTALKNLAAAGLTDIVCYEESGAIGGTWVFDEDPARTTVYETTHIISSKSLTAFEDYPMPADYPDFPSQQQMCAYFQDYARHFDLARFVKRRHRVECVTREADGSWRLVVSGPDGTREDVVDALLICSGHLREPLLPHYPGTFSGRSLHSKEFKRGEGFRGQRVLVVGGGNSACDIAVEVGRFAGRAVLSMRRGYHIMPKILFGRPLDVLYARLRRRLPRPLLRPVLRAVLRLGVGPLSKFGLQEPLRDMLELHPTLNTNILSALRDGIVVPRPGIARLDGDAVEFADGRREAFDTIIWATGFRMAFPFFDQSVIDWDTAKPPPLYLKMMHERFGNLFFIGLFQPIGCIWRLADHQARLAALQVTGRLRRPADIAARIAAEINSPHWPFDHSPRHAVEVDYHDFRAELMRELAAV